jgi:RNA-directed DNA polymerase
VQLILTVPTILDRCQQAIVKHALEPYWEAHFEATSYGFRPGRSTHDAIERIYSTVNTARTRHWVLDADIEKAFDQIDHKFLMQRIDNFPGRKWVKVWLKSGVMEAGAYQSTWRGTPQGGVISPLLMNLALDGMEEILGIGYEKRGFIDSKSPYVVVRYADDFVVMAKSKEACQQAKELLVPWLQTRGLRLSETKTRIVHLSEGLDFLGVNIRHYAKWGSKRGKVTLCKPTKEAEKNFVRRLKSAWKLVQGMSVEQVIDQLNPKILGWGNYYRPYCSRRTFSRLEHWMWLKQARHCARQHPQKGWDWRMRKYWGKIPGRKDRWVFMNKETGKFLWKLTWLNQRRHVLVKGKNSPDDGKLGAYWQQRRKSAGYALSGRKARIWIKQEGLCAHCKGELAPSELGERVHIHHIIPKSQGGGEEISNLSMVHSVCHEQIHSPCREDNKRPKRAA